MRTAQWNKERKCENCGRSFMAARSDARSCGAACKKALQRGSKSTHMWCRKAETRMIVGAPGQKADAGTVPFVAAGGAPALSPLSPTVEIDENAPRAIIAALMQAWPQGRLVLHKQSRGPAKPGRINWNSAAGDELKMRFGSPQFCRVESACVPVEELTGIRVRLVADLRLA